MLELVTLPPTFGLRNVSPFCFKAELLLVSLELEFSTRTLTNPAGAPKGKLPYLVADGKTVADSELIAEYLDGVTGGAVYAGLSDEQKALGLGIARLVEEHLYWTLVASRWLDDLWWPNVVDGFFRPYPGFVRGLASWLARRDVRRGYYLQGLGRHSLKEQQDFARRDLAALNTLVSDEGFLFGQEKPGIFDFTITGLMATAYDQEPLSWFNDVAEDFRELERYCERVQDSVGIYARYV